MSLYHLLTFLALALFSMAIQIPGKTDLASRGKKDEIDWEAATISLLPYTIEVIGDDVEGTSLSDKWNLPPGLLFCNNTLATPINHNYVTNLMYSAYADKSSSSLLRASSGELWKVSRKIGVRRNTQIYICNFGAYDVPFSVAEYSIVDGILNAHCGDVGGWVLFREWLLWVGRDATNDDGSFRPACGVSPPS